MDLNTWNGRTLNVNQMEIMLRHSGISNFNVLEFQFQYLYMYTSGWLVVVKAMPTPPDNYVQS